MNFHRLAIAALAVGLPFAAAACGDDSTGDLSTGDMSKKLQDIGMPKEQADCMAEGLKDADISEDDLKAFTESSDLESEVGKKMMEISTTCVTDGGIPATSSGDSGEPAGSGAEPATSTATEE